MRNVNTAIERTQFPTPTMDDLIFKLKEAKYFTKLDLNSALHQLELHKDRYITDLQTEDRIKRFKRLIFDLNSASEQLQHYFQITLADILGAINIADDILLFAESITKHDKILKHVFQKFYAKGLTLNLSKCIFSKEQLEHFGFIFPKAGIQPSDPKINPLKNAQRPQDIKGIRSYLGMVYYLKRFIPDFSTLTYPRRQLTHKNTKFVWADACAKSFDILNNLLMLTDTPINTYFDEQKETILYCDASPFGLSLTLLQNDK